MNDDSQLSYPLIVIEGLDVSLYGAIRQLENDLEGVDVEDDVYRAYDATGRVLKLEAYGVKRARWSVVPGGVRAGVGESEPTHASELRIALLRHLEAAGESVHQDADLATLIEQCKVRHHYRRTRGRWFERWRRR